MKYPYHIDYTPYGSPIMRLPDEIGQVIIFLLSDFQQPIRGFYTSHLDSVLHGKMPYAELGGNSCRLEIRPDFTRVIDTLAEDKTNESCLIETSELREILDIWCQILDEPANSPRVAV